MAKDIRILLVAMANSVHTARWIRLLQISDNFSADIVLFDSTDSGTEHADMCDITVYHRRYWKQNRRVKQHGIRISHWIVEQLTERYLPYSKPKQLTKIIKEFHPDVIHSLETQHAGYLVETVKNNRFGDFFPPWMHTNWGSDIYLLGHIPEHKKRIRSVLSSCDYYSCECYRDVTLAREFGFSGTIMPVIPNTGGFDLEYVAQLRLSGKRPSQRKSIVLKGHQDWAGRALFGLRALELCADVLSEYEIFIYSARDESVSIKARLLSEKLGIPFHILPLNMPHEEMLKLHGQARISVGLSIGDGISTSFLEALVMGSFPIQSCTACADEWIQDGVGGFIVPPEDPELIANAIRKALTDDSLVDTAERINNEMVAQKLDIRQIAKTAATFYTSIVEHHHE